jgi:hypothetical protein
MRDRRIETRMLCADLVEIQWRDQTGRRRHAMANLEDISLSGACLQVERPIPLGCAVHIAYPSGELAGAVKYCIFREIGYFLGVEFEPGTRWSPRSFRPQHLLDPRRMAVRAASRPKDDPPQSRPN